MSFTAWARCGALGVGLTAGACGGQVSAPSASALALAPQVEPTSRAEATPQTAARGAKGAASVDEPAGRLSVRSSAGCGKASPGPGPAALDVDGTSAHYILSLPPTYDGRTVYPLVFGLHGRNRTDRDCKDTDCRGLQSELGAKAVIVYMKSLGGTGWEHPEELELNVKFFQRMLSQVRQSSCVDENRVFVAGTSSGANFANILACRFGDEIRGVIPVAGRMPETEGCKGPVAALLIHGVDDDKITLPQGSAARDQYRTWSSCSDRSTPPVPALHARVAKTRESHECAEYAGCAPRSPVVWCEHSEGGYDGSTHGWPNFGGEAIADFIARF